MLIFKPKRTVGILLFFSFLIGLGVPFLIYMQEVLPGHSFVDLDVRSWIKILFPTFFLFAALRVIYTLKTIEIDQDNWKVKYVFPKRKRVFGIADIESIQKIEGVSYKYRIPVTTFKIRLKNSARIKVSSNEITDFEKFERILNKKEYKALKKK